LVQAFPKLHDRESAVWPLKVTNRLDKYNVFVIAHGGGLTGQAESITLGLSKALLVQEPALKPVLRKGMFYHPLKKRRLVAHTFTAGCITRIMKRVERKKAGRVKARKKPAWNRR
jgi:small subunit ribosomal protein S9